MRKQEYPLQPGDLVRAIPQTLDQLEVNRVGTAGFTVKESSKAFWWGDRGKTWASSKLDALDTQRTRFRQAATTSEGK